MADYPDRHAHPFGPRRHPGPHPGGREPRSPLATAVRTGRRRGLPRTLSFDIGGTGLKASVLSSHGELLHEPVRTPTPYPLRPEQLVATLAGLTTGLPTFQRISAGFPGMIRAGRILSAPHFISPTGPEGKPSADLVEAWKDFDLQSALAAALGKPCRAANDADVQGAALVKGQGLELVITLGTGVGTALFWEGKLAPPPGAGPAPPRQRRPHLQRGPGRGCTREGGQQEVERPCRPHPGHLESPRLLRPLLHRRGQLQSASR